MNTKSARISSRRFSFADILLLSVSLTVAFPGTPLSAHARSAQADRPDWIAQPKSSDSMYVYVVGHAAGQASETDARAAALKNARQKFASQIDSDAPVPASRIRGAEVLPGCVHTEVTTQGVECWVQASYSIAEKKKLTAKLEREAQATETNEDTPRKDGVLYAKDNTEDASSDNQPSPRKTSGTATGKPIPADPGSEAASGDKPAKSAAGKSGSGSGTYPAEPFNGLQINYSISGASLEGPEDKDGFTCTRAYKGKFGSGELRISGSSSGIGGVVNTDYGNFATILDAEVWAGGAKKEYHSKRAHEEAKGKDKNAKIDYGPGKYDLAIGIPDDARDGGFRIVMTYVNPRFGDRGLVVCGTFSGPGATDGETGAKAPSTHDTYVGKPDPQSSDEGAAWNIYRQYKASKARLAGYLQGAKRAGQDIASISYGFGAPFGVDQADYAAKTGFKEKAAEELAKVKQLEEKWDGKFAGYYGPLNDSEQSITTSVFDPKNPIKLQQVTMDLIEFRLRSFHKSDTSSESGKSE